VSFKTLPEAVASHIDEQRCKRTLIELVRVPSPQTELLEAEPLLGVFIRTAVEPRLRAMGVAAIRYDGMGNLIAEIGDDRSGRSLMLITNAMNQPRSTMVNAYAGDVVDGSRYGLPGEAVLGKGASEQKSTMAAMLVALEAVMRSGLPLSGRLVFLCCVSGETGKHDAIRSVVETEGVRADIAVLGGSHLTVSLGNRGRIDVNITVKGRPAHSSKPHEGCDAITGAVELIRMLRQEIDLSREHPALGRATLTINRMRSFPESTHTVQDRVELTVDRRLLPGEDPNAAFAEIRDVALRLKTMRDPASGKNWDIDVVLGPYMYASASDPKAPGVTLISEAFRDALHREPEFVHSFNAFDQGYLNHIGIDALNFGAGENRYAHTDLDMASVTRVREAAEVFALAILRQVGS
jgi:acetylornithine deacetylase/succinyl-diaminopimelate desuccinylase-like protein